MDIFHKKNRYTNGQVMLLTVIAISIAVFTVTALSGVFTVYQVRQAYNAYGSARAFYAADTGVELELYRWYKFRVNRSSCFLSAARNCPIYGPESWPLMNNRTTILTKPLLGPPRLLVNGRIGGARLGATRNLFLRRDLSTDPEHIIRGER